MAGWCKLVNTKENTAAHTRHHYFGEACPSVSIALWYSPWSHPDTGPNICLCLAVPVLLRLQIPFSQVPGKMMMTTYTGNNSMQCENNIMKSGTCHALFFFFKESSGEYECDEREGSINYNKEQEDQNAGSLWEVEFFRVVMEVGAAWIQLSLPSPAMPNCATHLRVGVISWSEFNEMEKSGPSNFIHVNPTQTHWTSPLPDFPLQRNIEREAIFFCFVSKGVQSVWNSTLRLTVNVKSGVGNFLRKIKKKKNALSSCGALCGAAVLLAAPRG